MYHKKSEKGQALVIIALAAVGLVAFTALAIDGGMVLSDRRHAQNAADTAAFAAALAKIRTPDYAPSSPAAQKQAAIDAGLDRADSNGYDNNGTSNTVQVNIPPVSGPYAGNDEYIQVIITSHVRTMFARIVGRQYVTNVADAVTRAQTGSSDTSSGLPAIAALKPTDTALYMNGNIDLTVINSGVFSNSNSPCSIYANGNGTYTVDTSYAIASGGTLCQNGNITLNGPVESGTQIPYPPTFINPPPPSITCSGTGFVSGNTINPGTFTSELIINSSGDYTFAPGNYCFDFGVKFNGNINITANDVNFLINANTFTINGNTTFTCNNMLVYGAGSSAGMEFNGNGTNNCSNTTFYMASGKVVLNGNASNTFTAPTSGSYKGLLIYLPYTNTTELTINGNSNQHFTGSVIAVGSPITINGNSGTFAVNTQFVGYTISVNGNVDFTVNYDPAQQYLPPEGPAIELIE